MDALILAQTIFYFTFSLLIIAVFVSVLSVSYYLVRIAKNINKLSHDLHQASEEVRENVKEIMERLSQVPFLSYFLKRSEGKASVKKGRNET